MKLLYILAGLMLISASVFAVTPCNDLTNFQGLNTCLVSEVMGGYYDFASLFIIGAVVLVLFAARIPGPLSLMIGIGLSYGLFLAFGASQMLLMLMLLQALGFIIMIGAGFFNIGKSMD